MQEMSRCIHCTRCVRFGQEVAGVMELGMIHRGEHSEITTVAGGTVDSELSGNMIDICPVGALTSKPFRYSARTWELSRRKSISPHDSTGANLIVQTKAGKVMRVRAAGERGRQRVLDRRPRPLLLRGAEQPVAPDRADDQAGRPVADGRLEHRARLRGRRPEAHQGRVRRAGHRRAGHGAQHGRRTAPAGQAGARPGQREHRLPHAPCRFRQHRAGRFGTLARHLDRVAVVAAVGFRGRLLPAQGPSAVRAAAAPGGAQGRGGAPPACAGRRLGDADGQQPDRRAVRAGCRRWPTWRRPWPQGKGIAAPLPATPGAEAAAIAQSLLGTRTQGCAAGQCGCAAPAGRRIAGVGAMDRRAHRRQRRLPQRGRQQRRRTAGRRDARTGRAECRADADAGHAGAAAAERRARAGRGRSAGGARRTAAQRPGGGADVLQGRGRRERRRAAADRPVHRNRRQLRQCRRPAAELQRRGRAAGRHAPGLEGAARAGQPARPARLRPGKRRAGARRGAGRCRRRRRKARQPRCRAAVVAGRRCAGTAAHCRRADLRGRCAGAPGRIAAADGRCPCAGGQPAQRAVRRARPEARRRGAREPGRTGADHRRRRRAQPGPPARCASPPAMPTRPRSARCSAPSASAGPEDASCSIPSTNSACR